MGEVALECYGQKGAQRPSGQYSHGYVEDQPVLLHTRDAVQEGHDGDLGETDNDDEEEIAGVGHLLDLMLRFQGHQMQCLPQTFRACSQDDGRLDDG